MRPRPRLEDGFALAKLPVEYCEAPSADFAYNVSFLSMIHEPGHSKLLLDQNWLDALVDQMGRTLYAQCVTVFFVDRYFLWSQHKTESVLFQTVLIPLSCVTQCVESTVRKMSSSGQEGVGSEWCRRIFYSAFPSHSVSHVEKTLSNCYPTRWKAKSSCKLLSKGHAVCQSSSGSEQIHKPPKELAERPLVAGYDHGFGGFGGLAPQCLVDSDD